MIEGRKRGVFFDVGHGGASFRWSTAVPLMKAGFMPDSISTDLHTASMNAGMKDMLNVMGKFLAMGMSLDDVILRSTWNPAQEIKLEELGNLSVGAPARRRRAAAWSGAIRLRRSPRRRASPGSDGPVEMTLRDGKVVYDLNGMTATAGIR